MNFLLLLSVWVSGDKDVFTNGINCFMKNDISCYCVHPPVCLLILMMWLDGGVWRWWTTLVLDPPSSWQTFTPSLFPGVASWAEPPLEANPQHVYLCLTPSPLPLPVCSVNQLTSYCYHKASYVSPGLLWPISCHFHSLPPYSNHPESFIIHVTTTAMDGLMLPVLIQLLIFPSMLVLHH